MGQFGNQPDFGTRAAKVIPVGNPTGATDPLNSAALYIGTGGTLVCKVVGGDADNGTAAAVCTVFKNIPNGTFFPVIVDGVYSDDDGTETTTCSNIVALY